MNANHLGFGLMRLPLLNKEDPKSVDIEQVKQMVDLFIEHGFTYFDTALFYHGGMSEAIAKTVLTSRHSRDRYTLATKLHSSFLKQAGDADRVFEGQLQKTGVEYFDYYLLHGVNSQQLPRYEEHHAFEWLLEKKKEGKIRHAGFSFHDSPELLEQILQKHPKMEFVQLQLNYLDWNSVGIQSRKCYEVAEKYHVPVIVMEPVKGGTLVKGLPESARGLMKEYAPDRSEASWAIRFAASQKNVMMVLSGMSDLDQLKDNISYMEKFEPLNEKEYGIIEKVVDRINANIAVPCTGCSYCVDGCPMDIPIPRYFSLYNANLQESKDKGWLPQEDYYDSLAAIHGKASDCIACGQCEGACPQHLPVIRYMQDVADHFECG